MKLELKTISLWPFIKVAVLLNTAIGFILGIFYALFLDVFINVMSSMPGLWPQDLSDADLPLGAMIIMFPIMFALMGGIVYTILGVILVTLYNLAASIAGGLEFEFAQVGQFTPVNQPQTPSYYSSYPGYSPPTSSTAIPAPPKPSPQQPPSNPPTQGFE